MKREMGGLESIKRLKTQLDYPMFLIRTCAYGYSVEVRIRINQLKAWYLHEVNAKV